MVVMAGSCHGAPDVMQQRPGRPAEAVGSIFLCAPGFDFQGHERVVYPPQHPSTPTATVRPDRCFASLRDAIQAGYRPAAEPPQTEALEVAGVYLVRPEPALARFCRKSARLLGFAVPCPTLVPTTPTSVVDCGGYSPGGCLRTGAFVLDGGFAGPPGYRGVQGQNSGHLWILADRLPDALDLQSCYGAVPSGTVPVRGRRGRWIECPDGSGLNSGHVVLVWRERGVSYAVSLHGRTKTNRLLDLAIAQHLRLVSPTESSG